MIEFRMPSLGADMEDGILIKWYVKPGDTVKRGDIIADVETMKGIIEIEVFDDGVIEQILIKEEEKVPVGTLMVLIAPLEGGATAPKEPLQEAKMAELHPIEEKKPTPGIPIVHERPSEKPHERIHATPLAKRIAEENHIDLSTIHGTGENNTITREDVEKAIAEKEEKRPTTFTPDTLEEKKEELVTPVIQEAEAVKPTHIMPTETIRMAVAAAMSKSNREIPHYYLESTIDMSKALAWLSEANRQRSVKNRLLPVVLLIKAVAKALEEFPDLNATWENGLQRKTDINIGFVVSLRAGGLVVPAIHQANERSFDTLMEMLNDIIPRARVLKLRSSELSDSTITLTNIGEGGAHTVFGVIYPPQVAIVGFGSITEQPYAENGLLGVRPMIHATLAGDHRATDGLTGSRFLASVKNKLQNPETL